MSQALRQAKGTTCAHLAEQDIYSHSDCFHVREADGNICRLLQLALAVLGFAEQASANCPAGSVLRKRFLELSMVVHPDKNLNSEPHAEEVFLQSLKLPST